MGKNTSQKHQQRMDVCGLEKKQNKIKERKKEGKKGWRLIMGLETLG